MTKRYTFALSLMIFITQMLAFAGGDGSSSSPYQVSTLAELDDVRNYLDSCFIQTADIDASETSTWNNGLGWEPIGDDNAPFTGVYDGQGHAVSGVMSHRENSADVGLFGQTSGATIANLLSLDCDVLGSARVGGLVGYAIGGGVSNCGASGLSRGTWATGGLIGKALDCAITDCYSLANVEMFEVGERKGGLAGLVDSCVVTNCYARGSVTGGNLSGGLIGAIDNSDLVRCYAAGPMTVVGEGGGLVGHVIGECTATRCYWDTEATGMSTSDLGAGKTTAEMTYFYKLHADGWDFASEIHNGTADIWDFDMSGVANDGYPCLAWENTPNFLQPPAGEGVQADPHLVATLFDLFWIRVNDDAWDHWFLQTADIDAYDTQNWNNGAGFNPIGEGNGGFSGHYDGDGHAIDGLYCHVNESYGGLFGYVSYALIKNLTLTNVDIDYHQNCGALAGKIHQASVVNCHSSGAVDGYYSGGLAGYLSSGSSLNNCSSSVSVESGSYGGGLVGYMLATEIRQSFATGDVQAANSDAGGLVGRLVSGSLYDCYSTGSVNGFYGGGLVADNSGSIYRCYSTGHVSGSAVYGGLVAWSIGTITDSFWDTETSGQSSSYGGGVGLTSTRMKLPYAFYEAGWDFEQEYANGFDNIWDVDLSGAINNGYPYLFWQDGDATSLQALAGAGTVADPRLIGSLFDLWLLSNFSAYWFDHFLQTADIDASDTQYWNDGAGFSPIGVNVDLRFYGDYDGGGHTISNLYIDRESEGYIGLFGYTYNSEMKNLTLTNADISGSYYVGAVAGWANHSSVTNCHTSGSVNAINIRAGGVAGEVEYGSADFCSSSATVHGGSEVGGLLGALDASVASNCFATGNASSSGNHVGGLIGYQIWNGSRIERCYATGNASGNYAIGGLVGYAEKPVSECYSTGHVSGNSNVHGFAGVASSSLTGCMWNIETSGQAGANGDAIGLTTAEMQTVAPYVAEGWDLEGEIGNGTDDWWLLPPGEYPKFNQYDTPVITAVQDTPNDQGRQVRLRWDRAPFDDGGSFLEYYSVWRRVDDARAVDSLSVVIDDVDDIAALAEDNTRTVYLLTRDTMWTCLTTVPAMGDNSYIYYAPTQIDSSAVLQPSEYEAAFVVYYHYTGGRFSTNIATGYSVDNIPPYPTDNVRVAVNTNTRNATLTLTWDEVTQGGLNGNSYPEQNGVWYRVYAGASPDFACDENSLLTVTQETSCDVDITTYDRRYYKVTASDQP